MMWAHALESLGMHQILHFPALDTRAHMSMHAIEHAGKSTLINALCGEDLLPCNNVPETARICKVVHSERVQQPFLMEPATSVASQQQQQYKRPSHSDSGNGPLLEEVGVCNVLLCFPGLRTQFLLM